MAKSVRKSGWMGCVAALMLACAGCGSSGVTVSGDVTCDGKPVDSGSIVFEPVDGVGPSQGGTIENGKFLLEGEGGLTPGKKNVRITAVMKTGKKMEASRPAPPGTMIDEIVRVSAPLQTVDIVEGKTNELTFQVTSKKSKG